MKKLYFILALGISTSAFGQVKVNSNGRTFFGTGPSTTSYGAINLTADGSTNGLSINGSSGTRFTIFKSNDRGYITRGTTNSGLYMSNIGRIFIGDSGALGTGGSTGGAVNIFTKSSAGLNVRSQYNSSGDTGIKVTTLAISNIFMGLAELESGSTEQTFYVRATGTVYSKNGYIQLSDKNDKENIKTLEGSLAKLEALTPVSYNYKSEPSKIATPEKSDIESEENSSLSTPKFSHEAKEYLKKEQERIQLGLIAQEVEEIVPEAVVTLDDGRKGIMYTQLIPLLIEGMKELKSLVEEQKDYITELEDKVNEITSEKEAIKVNESTTKNDNNQPTIKASLSQNVPNPFDQQTEISYQITESSTAYLGIYNLNGMQIKKYPLYDPQGTVVISASELNAGIYIYSLIVDNKEVDSKRMVLTD